ncbi:MAG: LamG domain-containing protein [Candidatus Peribacteraceae bacterium]|nr:LamG domain-containing protein [Candidatus Peribacteraceae bacterium]
MVKPMVEPIIRSIYIPPSLDSLASFVVSAHDIDTAIVTAVDFDTRATSYQLEYLMGLTPPATNAGVLVLLDSDSTAFQGLKTPINYIVPQDDTSYAFTFSSIRSGSVTVTNIDTVWLIHNTVPYVADVRDSGWLYIDSLSTLLYTYQDDDGDSEGTSTYKWYRNGVFTDSTRQYYNISSADSGFYIRPSVIPVASSGSSPGVETFADSVGPITDHTVYYFAENGIDIGQTTWTITGIVREADTLTIEVNDTSLYRIIGDSSLAFTDRLSNTSPSPLITATYGMAVYDADTKIQYLSEDTDTLKFNVGGWQFNVDYIGGGATPSTLLDNLVAYWKLDEASGTVYDETTNDYDGTPINSPTQGVTGIVNDAVSFEVDDSEWIDFGTSFWDPGTSDFTVSAWFNVADSNLSQGVTGNWGTDPFWYIRTASGDVLVSVDYGATTVESKINGREITNNTWHLIILTLDRDGNQILYVDNVLKDTDDISAQSAVNIANANTHAIGGVGNNTGFGADNLNDGIIDQVCVWSRVITSDERAELYNSGSGTDF